MERGQTMVRAPWGSDRHVVFPFAYGAFTLSRRLSQNLSARINESIMPVSYTHLDVYKRQRYDLAKVGRYKFNKKLMLKNRINGHVPVSVSYTHLPRRKR